jgi:hypothetical protein
MSAVGRVGCSGSHDSGIGGPSWSVSTWPGEWWPRPSQRPPPSSESATSAPVPNTCPSPRGSSTWWSPPCRCATGPIGRPGSPRSAGSSPPVACASLPTSSPAAHAQPSWGPCSYAAVDPVSLQFRAPLDRGHARGPTSWPQSVAADRGAGQAGGGGRIPAPGPWRARMAPSQAPAGRWPMDDRQYGDGGDSWAVVAEDPSRWTMRVRLGSEEGQDPGIDQVGRAALTAWPAPETTSLSRSPAGAAGLEREAPGAGSRRTSAAARLLGGRPLLTTGGLDRLGPCDRKPISIRRGLAARRPGPSGSGCPGRS